MADSPQPPSSEQALFLINYKQLNALFHYLKKRSWEEANPLVVILQSLPPGQAVPVPQEPPRDKEPLKVAPKPDEPSKKEPPPEAAKE